MTGNANGNDLSSLFRVVFAHMTGHFNILALFVDLIRLLSKMKLIFALWSNIEGLSGKIESFSDIILYSEGCRVIRWIFPQIFPIHWCNKCIWGVRCSLALGRGKSDIFSCRFPKWSEIRRNALGMVQSTSRQAFELANHPCRARGGQTECALTCVFDFRKDTFLRHSCFPNHCTTNPWSVMKTTMDHGLFRWNRKNIMIKGGRFSCS